jgi:hypothetical protein
MITFRMPLITVLAVVTLPLLGADRGRDDRRHDDRGRDEWPKPAAIEKAVERVEYLIDHAARAKYRGRDVTFIPCDLVDINDETRERGMIVGKLISEGPSADRLPEGTYQIYVRKRNDQWEAYFCQKYDPVAQSTEVKWMQNRHWPSFEVDNTTIHYWRLRIAW